MRATQTLTDTSVIAHGAIDVVSDTSHFHLHVFGQQEDDTSKQRGKTFKLWKDRGEEHRGSTITQNALVVVLINALLSDL